MENGLVSQHAYTVTGAEQVRLHGLGPMVLLLGTGVRTTCLSRPSIAEASVYHPYLWWRPSRTPRSFYSSRSSGAAYPHPPAILLSLRALRQGEGLAGLWIIPKESRMN